MLQDHLQMQRASCQIITVEPASQTIQAITRGGPVVISVFTTNPYFRWPKTGENWNIYQVNGNWYLDSILQNENDPTTLNELSPGDTHLNISGPIHTNTGNTVPQKYVTEVGDGTKEEFEIKHDLNDTAIAISAQKNNESMAFTYKIKDANSVVIKFATKPATNSVKVIIIG